jgi:hypothetical protein
MSKISNVSKIAGYSTIKYVKITYYLTLKYANITDDSTIFGWNNFQNFGV